MDSIDDLKIRLVALPKGYISKKVINGKERFYLQYRDGKKVVSKYIKSSELSIIEAQLEERKEFLNNLKIEIDKQIELIDSKIKILNEITTFYSNIDNAYNILKETPSLKLRNNLVVNTNGYKTYKFLKDQHFFELNREFIKLIEEYKNSSLTRVLLASTKEPYYYYPNEEINELINNVTIKQIHLDNIFNSFPIFISTQAENQLIFSQLDECQEN